MTVMGVEGDVSVGYRVTVCCTECAVLSDL